MSSISTATTAAYTAQTLRGTAKIDKVARADADVSDICTADWANDVDADLEEMNAVMRGSSGAYFWAIINTGFTYTGTGKRFAPLAGAVSQSADLEQYYSLSLAPHDGQIVRVSVMSDSATAGNTIVGTHIGSSAVPSLTAVETDTVNIASADTVYHADFTATSALTKGDNWGISFDSTGNLEGVTITIVVKYDTNT